MEEREFGEVIPISVGTAIAIESLGDPHPMPPSLWINVRTIIRNLIGAYANDLPAEAELLKVLMSEMATINDVVNALDSSCKIVWYYTTHKSIEDVFPYAMIKYAATEKQKHYNRLESKLVNSLFNNTKQIRRFDVKILGKRDNAYILTHQPIDLLSLGTFSSLKLLESHTGSLKPPSEWYTKLTGGKKLVGIPFNGLTIQIYGDGNRFRSHNRAAKKILTETAEKYNWTTVSTTDKIMYSLDKIHDIITRRLFKEMLHPKLR